jgi:hypothetical protein
MQRRRHDDTRGVRFANSYTHFDVGDGGIHAAVKVATRLAAHTLER